VSAGATVPLDLFCDIGQVLFSPEGRAAAAGDAALATGGRARRVVMTMPVFSGVYRAVAGSDLIALLPIALAHQIAGPVGLDVFEPPIPVDPVQITMIWHRRNSASPPHSWLRDQIGELLAPLDKKPDGSMPMRN
jgi:DNA-binding transcriptional LysR family regulator